METTINDGAHKEKAPGHDKLFTIFVNSKPKPWSEKKISYDQVIILAFGEISTDPNVRYTVTYSRGHSDKPQGTMVQGDVVTVKNEMKFDVTRTNKS